MEPILPMAINIERRSHYLLNAQEGLILDWLLVKHRGFNKEFNYSYEQIERETGVKRHSLDVIFNKFKVMGFLSVEAKGVEKIKTKKTHFNIDYKSLLDNLPNIIDEQNKDYYREWKEYLKSRSKGQKGQNVKMDWKSESEEYHSTLVDIWNKRIDIYNSERTDGRKQSHTSLPKSDLLLKNLYLAVKEFSLVGVENAFTAFADEVIKDEGDFNIERPLHYFLSNKEGGFRNLSYYLDFFNIHYSYKS